MSEASQTQPPPIGGPERDIDDRLAEALRRFRVGLMRPLWADLPDSEKDGWLNTAATFQFTLRDVGLKVEIEG